MYSVVSAHEDFTMKAAGTGCVCVDERMRFDWSAAAAVAGAAQATFRFACGSQRGHGQADLDHSNAHNGPAKHALFGEDSHLPQPRYDSQAV